MGLEQVWVVKEQALKNYKRNQLIHNVQPQISKLTAWKQIMKPSSRISVSLKI